MKHAVLEFAGLLLALAAFIQAVAAADAFDTAPVAPRELLAAIEAGRAPLVIDVRTPDEYAAGHVPGASLMPVQALPTLIGRLEGPKEQPIVVYCERGPRASLARTALGLAGYTRVIYLDGHMKGWRESGLRTVKIDL